MKTALLTFPGINREPDMVMALESASGHKPEIIRHTATDLGNPDLIVIPGGFSYGDYLRCGAMAARTPAMKEVVALANKGTPVLGVCNGFQILIEAGLLPGALLYNKDMKFICRHVNIRCENSSSPLTTGLTKGAIMSVPIAHGEGNYFADENTLKALEGRGRIAFRYCNDNGEPKHESNPNGSVSNIAGVLNETGTVLGLMPHPENATQPWQDNQSALPFFTGITTAILS